MILSVRAVKKYVLYPLFEKQFNAALYLLIAGFCKFLFYLG